MQIELESYQYDYPLAIFLLKHKLEELYLKHMEFY